MEWQGFFLFTDKGKMEQVPESGELVRWMQGEGKVYKEIGLAGTREFGVLDEYEKLEKIKCRPFNRITVDGDILTKAPIDEQGRKLAVYEQAWYEKARNLHIPVLPKIYDVSPLGMEYIKGKNIYAGEYSQTEKEHILQMLVNALKQLHAVEKIRFSFLSPYGRSGDHRGRAADPGRRGPERRRHRRAGGRAAAQRH